MPLRQRSNSISSKGNVLGKGSSPNATILLEEASVPMQQMQIGHGVAHQENRYAEVGGNLAVAPETSLATAKYSVKAEMTDGAATLNTKFASQSQMLLTFAKRISKIHIPYSDISEASALSLQSAFFATASNTISKTVATVSSQTTSQTTSTSQKTVSSAATALSQTASSSSSTSTNTGATTPTPSSSLSGGAIAGIVVGVIAAVALIAAGAFFLGRKYMRNAHNSTQATPSSTHAVPNYAPDMQEESYNDNGFGRSELPNTSAQKSELPGTSVPYDPYHNSRNELP